jgi:flagellar biogenesis protein FliO
MLSFDSPYEGQIFQDKTENLITLKLKDLSYNRLVKKSINSKIAQKLIIEPDKNSLKILIKSQNPIGLIASKTADGFGLRIRIKPTAQKTSQSKNSSFISKNNKQNIYADENSLDSRYISVVVVLFFMLIVMFWIKRRYSAKSSSASKSSWLFKKTSQNRQVVNVVYKKQLDTNNSVVLLEFEDKKYLVMSGSSNLLLDTFGAGEIDDKSQFEKAFEDNRKKLDDYLKLQDKKLEDYKEKASGEFKKEFDFYK